MVARVLLWGVGTSVLALLAGWVLTLSASSQAFGDDARRGEFLGLGAEFPNTLARILEGLQVAEGSSYMMLGLLVLMVTPLLRVLCSLAVFVYQRDRTYSVLTAIVVGLLSLSLWLGQTH